MYDCTEVYTAVYSPASIWQYGRMAVRPFGMVYGCIYGCLAVPWRAAEWPNNHRRVSFLDTDFLNYTLSLYLLETADAMKVEASEVELKDSKQIKLKITSDTLLILG